MLRICALALTLALTLPATASKKAKDYQDATLVTFHDVHAGITCNSFGDMHGTLDGDSMNGTTDATTNCHEATRRLYTIKSGDAVYVIQYDITASHAANPATIMATMGWSALFLKNSVLANQLPGTKLRVRSDGKHFVVRIGKRESSFNIVEAR